MLPERGPSRWKKYKNAVKGQGKCVGVSRKRGEGKTSAVQKGFKLRGGKRYVKKGGWYPFRKPRGETGKKR